MAASAAGGVPPDVERDALLSLLPSFQASSDDAVCVLVDLANVASQCQGGLTARSMHYQS
jgi:hypothetical protein